MRYEFFDHTADVKFKAYGATIEEAFEASALAFSKLVCKDLTIKAAKKKKISVSGIDLENLLYNFLEELIFLLDSENFIVRKADVKISDTAPAHPPETRLTATIYGDDTKNYKGLEHVKAATYAEMHVKKNKAEWEVQAVLDV